MSKKNITVLALVLALTVSAFASIPVTIGGKVESTLQWTPEDGMKSWMKYTFNTAMNVNKSDLKLIWTWSLGSKTKDFHNGSPSHNLGAFEHNYSVLTIKGPFVKGGPSLTTTIGPLALDWGTHYLKRNEAAWENADSAQIYGWKVEGIPLWKLKGEAFLGWDSGGEVSDAANQFRPMFGAKFGGSVVRGTTVNAGYVRGLKEEKKIDREYDDKQNSWFTGKSTNMALATLNQNLGKVGKLDVEGALLFNTNSDGELVGSKPHVLRVNTNFDKLIPNVKFAINASDVHPYFVSEWRYAAGGKARNHALLGDLGQTKYGVTASTKLAGFDLNAGYNWTGDKADNFGFGDDKEIEFLQTKDAINAGVSYKLKDVTLATDGSFAVVDSKDGTVKRATNYNFKATDKEDPDEMFWTIAPKQFEAGTSYEVRANASASTKLFGADAVAKYSFIWDKNLVDDVLPIWNKVELNYTGYKLKAPFLADALTIDYTSEYWLANADEINPQLPEDDQQDSLFFTTKQRLGLGTKVDIARAEGISLSAGVNFDNRYGNKIEGRTVNNVNFEEQGRWRDRKDPWYFDISANYKAPNGISFAARYAWPDNFKRKPGHKHGPDTHITVSYSASF